jgi:hypothetical protein
VTATITTRVQRMRLKDLRLLELNARYMKHETYQRLVDNIRADGCLTSVPFAALQPDGVYLVLSGNHRVLAAIEAGVEEGDVMVTDDPLPDQRALAIQLSHNALTGEDDPAVLSRLYESLEDVDWRSYSGLDDKTLGLLAEVNLGSLAEANLEWTIVMLIFLPEELERAKTALVDCRKTLQSREAWITGKTLYDRTLDALSEAGKAQGVTNVATELGAILGIYERHRDELGEFIEHRTPGSFVPLSGVVGDVDVPARCAQALQRALGLMIDRGEATTRHEALEKLATRYTSPPHE